jgi:hypothetical protein
MDLTHVTATVQHRLAAAPEQVPAGADALLGA